MLHVRLKALTTMAALSAVLVFGGVRVLHSDVADFQSTVSKMTTPDSVSLWLSYAPDCALLILLLVAPPRDFVRVIARRATVLLTHFEEFVQHKRPPPRLA
jgi:hypothetical protein